VENLYGRKTRVMRVTFDSIRKPLRIHLAVLVLYPIEVKRQLATVENAKARAVEIARWLIPQRLLDPPDLDKLNCSAEVIQYGLGWLWDVRQTLEDGTNVWLSEVERHIESKRPWWLW
jgi:hypothetical protein